jgi:hypothetical protein
MIKIDFSETFRFFVVVADTLSKLEELNSFGNLGDLKLTENCQKPFNSSTFGNISERKP